MLIAVIYIPSRNLPNSFGYVPARNKKAPKGRQIVAPYKRRGFVGAQCGVKKSRQPKNPEAGDSAEEINSFEGVHEWYKP